MRTISRRARICATTLVLALWTSTSQAFLEVPYNKDKSYGPDGPWQAVSFGVKYSNDKSYTTIDVYPSVLYGTLAALYIPSAQACSSDTTGQCASGGELSSIKNSSTYSAYTYQNTATDFYFRLNGTTEYTDVELPNQITFNSALTNVLNIAEMTYPNGVTVPVELGYGGLGGSPLDESMNAPLSLFQGGLTQSSSYGLHVGSAKLDYPGSLVFGGYNRGRVIGPVINYSAKEYGTESPLQLIDIEIGTETGDSPFDFEFQNDLMKIPAGGEFTSSLPTLVKPEYPYIFLNQQTLNAITTHLPVSFDSSSGFYLWNTDDPLYKKIVNSPAYLGFVFPSVAGNSANTTIKVPFKLLDLTLEKSVTGRDSDVPYLPFLETYLGGNSGLDVLLGRAFLQAAFIGTNWNTNTSWLAQAPGPGASNEGLGFDAIDLSTSMSSLNVQTGDSLFQKSWDGHWTVLGKSASGGDGGEGGSGSDNGSSSPLSGGAIAGIVIGAIALIAIVAAITVWCLVRRKRKARQSMAPSVGPGQSGTTNQPAWMGGYQEKYQGHGQEPYHQQRQELQADAAQRGELDGSDKYNKAYRTSPNPQQGGYGHYVGELPGHEAQELPANYRSQ